MSGRIGDLDSESLSIWGDKSRFPEEKPGLSLIDRRFLTALRGGSREGENIGKFEEFLTQNQYQLRELSPEAKRIATEVCSAFQRRLGSNEAQEKLNKFNEFINRPVTQAPLSRSSANSNAGAAEGISKSRLPAHMLPIKEYLQWMIGRPIEDSLVNLQGRIGTDCLEMSEQDILELMNWCRDKQPPLNEFPNHTEKFLKARTDAIAEKSRGRIERADPPASKGFIASVSSWFWGSSEAATEEPERPRETEFKAGGEGSHEKHLSREDSALINKIKTTSDGNTIAEFLQNGGHRGVTKQGAQKAIDVVYETYANSSGKISQDKINLIENHLKPLRKNPEGYHSQPERPKAATSLAHEVPHPKGKPRTREDLTFVTFVQNSKNIAEIQSALDSPENTWKTTVTTDGFQAAIDAVYVKYGDTATDFATRILKPLRNSARNR